MLHAVLKFNIKYSPLTCPNSIRPFAKLWKKCHVLAPFTLIHCFICKTSVNGYIVCMCSERQTILHYTKGWARFVRAALTKPTKHRKMHALSFQFQHRFSYLLHVLKKLNYSPLSTPKAWWNLQSTGKASEIHEYRGVNRSIQIANKVTRRMGRNGWTHFNCHDWLTEGW